MLLSSEGGWDVGQNWVCAAVASGCKAINGTFVTAEEYEAAAKDGVIQGTRYIILNKETRRLQLREDGMLQGCV